MKPKWRSVNKFGVVFVSKYLQSQDISTKGNIVRRRTLWAVLVTFFKRTNRGRKAMNITDHFNKYWSSLYYGIQFFNFQKHRLCPVTDWTDCAKELRWCHLLILKSFTKVQIKIILPSSKYKFKQQEQKWGTKQTLACYCLLCWLIRTARNKRICKMYSNRKLLNVKHSNISQYYDVVVFLI